MVIQDSSPFYFPLMNLSSDYLVLDETSILINFWPLECFKCQKFISIDLELRDIYCQLEWEAPGSKDIS